VELVPLEVLVHLERRVLLELTELRERPASQAHRVVTEGLVHPESPGYQD